MKENNFVSHLRKTVDKVFFGFEDIDESEVVLEEIEDDNEDEFDVIRSVN